MVRAICSKDEYNEAAVKLAQKIYLPQMPLEFFVGEVKRRGFVMTEKPRVVYPEEMSAKEFYEWKHGGADRYINRIIIQPVARMDVGGE